MSARPCDVLLLSLVAAACPRGDDAGRFRAGAEAAEDRGAFRARADCLDRELARRGLNSYGDPADTMYAGGSPLFDEQSGRSRDRLARILDLHPDLAAACPPARASDD